MKNIALEAKLMWQFPGINSIRTQHLALDGITLKPREHWVRVEMHIGDDKCSIPAKILYEDDNVIVLNNFKMTNAPQFSFIERYLDLRLDETTCQVMGIYLIKNIE